MIAKGLNSYPTAAGEIGLALPPQRSHTVSVRSYLRPGVARIRALKPVFPLAAISAIIPEKILTGIGHMAQQRWRDLTV